MIVLRWAGDEPPLPFGAIDILKFENTSYAWGTDAGNWDQAASRFRPVAGSLTVELVASGLYDQGETAGCKIPCQLVIHPDEQFAAGAVPHHRLTVDTDLGIVPISLGEVQMSSARSDYRSAKDGGFSVQNYIDPAVGYAGAAPIRTRLVFQYRLTIGGALQTIDTTLGSSLTTAPTYAGMNVSYALFQGLLPQATLSAKRVHAWEVTLQGQSPWLAFATPGPAPDMAAMEMAAMQMHELSDYMPASANSFGSFFQKLVPAVKNIWGVVGPAVKAGVSLLPGGSAIATGLGVVEKLGGALL
jgi:hypothetical protein